MLLVLSNLIENEGSHKNLYMVDEDLFIVIKHALIQMRDG